MGLPGQENNEAKRQALEVAEAARETTWERSSFMGHLFMGQFKPELLHPFPVQPDTEKQQGDEFCAKVKSFLEEHCDADEVDEQGVLPQKVIDGLVDLGVFGMKIPEEYGGLGFSQVNYNRTAMTVTAHCASTAVWISAHQSIGVPQPLKMFGTPEQKKKYLPRLAKGDISAFALTEPGVGSDPARMSVEAKPDGDDWVLNGEKLWCTNGPAADILVVMARTPPKIVNGHEIPQITAFIVDCKEHQGVEVLHECQFLGLRAIRNGWLRFTNVRVPKENIILGEGRGLKLALATLNTGRLTLPACCTGVAKRCLDISRRWANEREQWGAVIGKHEAVAAKLSHMCAHVLAMESMVWLTSGWVDRKDVDIRIEAAMAKMFCSEWSWCVIDDTLQIRGGRGYEKAESLRKRGESPDPVERFLRDGRINTIVEGTSEIMRLFIAREALDKHMKIGLDVIDPSKPLGVRLKAAIKAGLFYAKWLPSQYINGSFANSYGGMFAAPLRSHVGYVQRTAHKLARRIFFLMMIHQAALEARQQVLGRVVEIGTDLFAIMSTVSYAQHLVKQNPNDRSPLDVAHTFCLLARERIDSNFRKLFANNDRNIRSLARQFLKGEFGWLEKGV